MMNKPIEVIAHFGKDNTLNPLRFQVDTEDGPQAIKIEHSILKSINQVKAVYICNIIVNGAKHQCEIWYYIQELRWILYDMR